MYVCIYCPGSRVISAAVPEWWNFFDNYNWFGLGWLGLALLSRPVWLTSAQWAHLAGCPLCCRLTSLQQRPLLSAPQCLPPEIYVRIGRIDLTHITFAQLGDIENVFLYTYTHTYVEVCMYVCMLVPTDRRHDDRSTRFAYLLLDHETASTASVL